MGILLTGCSKAPATIALEHDREHGCVWETNEFEVSCAIKASDGANLVAYGRKVAWRSEPAGSLSFSPVEGRCVARAKAAVAGKVRVVVAVDGVEGSMDLEVLPPLVGVWEAQDMPMQGGLLEIAKYGDTLIGNIVQAPPITESHERFWTERLTAMSPRYASLGHVGARCANQVLGPQVRRFTDIARAGERKWSTQQLFARILAPGFDECGEGTADAKHYELELDPSGVELTAVEVGGKNRQRWLFVAGIKRDGVVLPERVTPPRPAETDIKLPNPCKS
ncbi:MAG: hypothetical protein R3B72_49450 [Polyangiaceae bacterium]